MEADLCEEFWKGKVYRCKVPDRKQKGKLPSLPISLEINTTLYINSFMHFVKRGRSYAHVMIMFQIFLNNEEMDSVLYMEKFTFAGGSKVGLPFCRRRLLCCVLVSATSMVAAICVNPAAATALVAAAAQSAAASGEESPSASLTSSVVTKSLGGRRARILHADIAVLREGKMVIAVSNGNPTHPIGVYSVHPSLRDENGFDLSLDVGNFPSIYLSTSQKSGLIFLRRVRQIPQ